MKIKYFFISVSMLISTVSSREITPENIGMYSFSISHIERSAISTPFQKINPYQGQANIHGFTGNTYPLFSSPKESLQSKIHEIGVTADGNCTLYALGLTQNDLVQYLTDGIDNARSLQELTDVLSSTQLGLEEKNGFRLLSELNKGIYAAAANIFFTENTSDKQYFLTHTHTHIF